MENNKPILGVTLYSFTNEWLARKYDFGTLVAKVAELGLGPAVEVVGFQSFRTYPDVTDETADHFRNLMAKYNLMPSCLGANCDVGRRKDRLMTEEEILDYLKRQLVTAQKLGFPVMRIQTFVGPKVFERIAPLAEKAGVHVACELHSPLSVDHPDVMALRELFDRVKSAFIGFVPDFSSVMNLPPKLFWENLRSLGAPESLIEASRDIWISDKPIPEKFGALAETSARLGVSPLVAGQLNTVMTMFGHMRPEKLAELLPYTHHIHGKFYEVDESGCETSMPYPAIMSVLKKEGYHGTISAEWEGHAFTQEAVGFERVQAWHAMCTRLLAN